LPTINGAGASFPDAIYGRWAHSFYELNGTRINYQKSGSSAGISQVKAKTISFGGSDAPLEEKELEESGLVQFPLVIGAIVPVVNLKGVKPGELKLSSDVLAKIYLGDIKKWNDAQLVQLNPDVKLPDSEITTVRRADGSGTTWIFTSYLSAVSPEFEKRVGIGKEVKWPVGIGGKGNDGVASSVAQVDGSIGYVEYTYAVQNKMTYTQLENKEGKYVSPTLEAFEAATSNADWASAKNFYVILVNQPGEKSWPITGASFVLIHKEQPDPKIATAMIKFFDWCYRHGAEDAKKMDFVPLPASVYEMVEKMWDAEVRSGGKPVAR
jgi:phosphate transport system substrate-binding protein